MRSVLFYCAVAIFVGVAYATDRLINVNKVVAEKDDEYVCQSHEITDDNIYVTNFTPSLNRTVVHHVLIYGCKVAQAGIRKNCYVPCDWSPSGGGSRIVYAWANEAPELNMPSDVSFQLGTSSGWKYLVIQVHYKDKFKTPEYPDSSGISIKYQSEKTKYTAGIYLFASSLFRIQPHQTDVRALLKCKMELEQPIYVFAVRVHAHSMGKAIGVFVNNSNHWDKIVERSPQRAQAFYPLPKPVRLNNGFDVAARCVFDSSDSDHAVGMGSTRNDEMCNAYLMFYTEDLSFTYNTCDEPSASLQLPEPDATELAFKGDPGHSHAHGPAGHDHGAMNHENHDAGTSAPESHQHDHSDHAEEKQMAQHEGLQWKFEVHDDSEWKAAMHSERFPVIGQVGGVSRDDAGNFYVFHRGSRTWNEFSFDLTNRYAHKTEGPIDENTILVIAPNGTVIDAWGAGVFFMPHGITVCQQSDSIWLTDVALHQIFRYSFKETMNRKDKSVFNVKPNLVLGEAFEPGSVEGHFCKPAGVATLPDGSAVVADGYCNTRLLSISASGKVARSIRLTDQGMDANVVHAVVYEPISKLLFASDRENNRVFAVSPESLSVQYVLKPSTVETKIYGLAVFTPLGCHESVVVALNQSETGRPAALMFISPTGKNVVDTVPLPVEVPNAHTMVFDSAQGVVLIGQVYDQWNADMLIRFHASLMGSCGMAATMEQGEGLIASIYRKNEQVINWVSSSFHNPSTTIGLLVFVLSISVVVIISVLVCRVCRRRGTPSTRRAPRGGANSRDYAAQYSLLVGDAAVKRSGKKNNSGFEDFESDDDEDDTIVDRRMVSRPPGGGAKSRFVGFPPEGGTPPRKMGDSGNKIV